jgi:hypothetical protein
MAEDVASCARTDAKKQDRDVQMKYDIAKNEDGPLRKTMDTSGATSQSMPVPAFPSSNTPHSGRHPGLRERFENIESHLAVKYGNVIQISLLQPN